MDSEGKSHGTRTSKQLLIEYLRLRISYRLISLLRASKEQKKAVESMFVRPGQPFHTGTGARLLHSSAEIESMASIQSCHAIHSQ